jgi:predicted TIM-barrel fold metal-dependent hydrolase
MLLRVHFTTFCSEVTIMLKKTGANYIDAHVHLWSDNLQKYPLAAEFTPGDMRPSAFSPQELRHYAEPSGAERFVLVQMSYYGYDNSFMLDVIRDSPQDFKGIAVIDWKNGIPDVEMRELAKRGVRGFRVFPERADDIKQLEGESCYRMFRCGVEAGLTICFLIDPEVLSIVQRLCKKFPGCPIIIDHLARIGMASPIREEDVRSVCLLAKYPGAKIKLSGFYALGEGKPPHDDLSLLIRRVYEAFGPKRLMWGSDCPFQLMNETYEDSFNLIQNRLDFLSSEDREWILRRTAEESFFN